MVLGKSRRGLQIPIRRSIKSNVQQSKMPNSAVTIEQLLLDIKDIRNQGYSVESNEFDEMVTVIEAPIFDRHNRLIAATSTIAPSTRVDAAKIAAITTSLTSIARQISEVLIDGA